MILKRVLSTICTLALVGAISTTAFADNIDLDLSEVSNESAVTQTDSERKEHSTLTDDQKAKSDAKKASHKAKYEEMNKKWLSLTTDQKEEVYSLKDKSTDIKIELLNKYLELGLIDESAATKMKTKLNASKTKMRENPNMPLFHGGSEKMFK